MAPTSETGETTLSFNARKVTSAVGGKVGHDEHGGDLFNFTSEQLSHLLDVTIEKTVAACLRRFNTQNAADSSLSSLPGHCVAPEGYTVVPNVPTPAMLATAAVAGGTVSLAYTAMVRHCAKK